jgi:hypothetical protein
MQYIWYGILLILIAIPMYLTGSTLGKAVPRSSSVFLFFVGLAIMAFGVYQKYKQRR